MGRIATLMVALSMVAISQQIQYNVSLTIQPPAHGTEVDTVLIQIKYLHPEITEEEAAQKLTGDFEVWTSEENTAFARDRDYSHESLLHPLHFLYWPEIRNLTSRQTWERRVEQQAQLGNSLNHYGEYLWGVPAADGSGADEDNDEE